MLGGLHAQRACQPTAGKAHASRRSPPTNDTHVSQEIAKLVLNHRTLLSRLPSTRCTIAGVSFEGRQDRVKQLRKNTPVLLVPEPSNVHDSLAVGVQTLAGGRLGFVPRAHNPTFLGRGFTPGFVVSVGQPQSQLLEDESKALWGALIWTSPSAVPLLPQPLPAALRPPAAGQAPSPELEQLRRLLAASGEQDGPAAAALRASKGTCELTAVPASDEAPLRLVPLWRLDLQKRAVQLLRLCVATAPVARAFEFLGMAPGQPDYDQVCVVGVPAGGPNIVVTSECVRAMMLCVHAARSPGG